MPKEVEAPAIDEESLKGLADAKSKKTRNFVLVVKGGQVLALVVFRKGSYGSRIQQAKSQGFKGEAVCGCVTGDGSTLLFQLAGNEAVAGVLGSGTIYESDPVAATKVKSFLAANGLSLKAEFRIVTDPAQVQVEGGEPAAEAPAPAAPVRSDEMTAFMDRLKALLPQIKGMPHVKAFPGTAGEKAIGVLAGEAGVLAKNKAFDKAGQALDEIEAQLKRAGTDPSAPGAPKPTQPGPAASNEKAMAAWQAARGEALNTLKLLEGAIRAMKDPDGDAAIILVRAIQANLTASPSTRRQQDELERYITTDDILLEAEAPNGFGIKVELRKPLLAALAKLRGATAPENNS